VNIKRIIRCILAYTYAWVSRNERIRRIKDAFWESGGVLPGEKMDVLSADDRGFYLEYRKLVGAYQNSFPLDLDLTKVRAAQQDLDPPKSLYVEVRVLADCGDLMTADGSTVRLDRGATEIVRKADVEHLIRQGQVMLTNNN